MAILAQLSADFALTYNFHGIRILGASRGHLCDSVIFLSVHTPAVSILADLSRSELAGILPVYNAVNISKYTITI